MADVSLLCRGVALHKNSVFETSFYIWKGFVGFRMQQKTELVSISHNMNGACPTLSLTSAHSPPKESNFSPPATRKTRRTARKSSKLRSSRWCRTVPSVCLHPWTSWKPRWEAWRSPHLWWALLISTTARLLYSTKGQKNIYRLCIFISFNRHWLVSL